MAAHEVKMRAAVWAMATPHDAERWEPVPEKDRAPAECYGRLQWLADSVLDTGDLLDQLDNAPAQLAVLDAHKRLG